jgi:hypothetical protein
MAGLAINGGSGNIDLNFTIGNAVTTTTFANTSTAQYRLAYAQVSTAADDLEADFMVTTTMIPVGVIQSYNTNGSDSMGVRLFGVTKVYANDSIQAFAYVTHAGITASGASCGYVIPFTPNTDFTSSVASKRIVGIALQQAQKTGAALTILLSPQIAY